MPKESKTQQHEYERRLTVARNEFYGAAVNLLKIWQEDESGELLIDGYPFKTAFEEVVWSIGTWSFQKVKKRRGRDQFGKGDKNGLRSKVL